MSGSEYEATIRRDATERLVRTLEENLLLSSVLGIGHSAFPDELNARIRALRKKLNPGEEPALARHAMSRSPIGLMDSPLWTSSLP